MGKIKDFFTDKQRDVLRGLSLNWNIRKQGLFMRGVIMTKEPTTRYTGLSEEYQSIAADYNGFLTIQSNIEKTLDVIKDADNGVDLSDPFDNVDDLMVALNA